MGLEDPQDRASPEGERHWFENDPDLASLRDNGRFKALLERM